MIQLRRAMQRLAAACAMASAGCVVSAPGLAPSSTHAAHGARAEGGTHAAAGAAAPYAGQEARRIRSLTDAQVDDIAAGRGMGLARPAELASHPGPMHVLEHARDLGLDAGQIARTRALIAPMREAAVRHGERWLDAEREIDRLFATRSATPQALARALEASALAQAAVRAAHLDAHIAQAAILTAEQVARYDALRGYASVRGR